MAWVTMGTGYQWWRKNFFSVFVIKTDVKNLFGDQSRKHDELVQKTKDFET